MFSSALLRCTVLGLTASLAAGQVRIANTEAQRFHNDDSVTRRLHSASSPPSQPQAHNISVPIDHFHNESIYEPHSDKSFPLRYWFDAQHYREGGPVIVLASGETSGEDRLPFLDYGIVAMLAEATNGIGVILEHRYYGESFPVPDLSAENMRFLSTEQALADTAYFAQHVEFPGLEHRNLTAPNAPYIIYGGSYAGAFAAFARKIYPDLFWGAIASSAVTEAIVDYWEYYEAARLFAPGDCATVTQKLTHAVDTILLDGKKEQKKLLKDVFGLGELRDDDFAMALSRGISGLQSTNWDPEEDDSDFAFYCSSVSSDDILFASTRHLVPAIESLLCAGGYEKEAKTLTTRMLNYIGYIRTHLRDDLRGACKGKSVKECYSSRGTNGNTDLHQGMMRSWGYQTCTQWGYWQTGSGVPKDQLPLISRLIDIEYSTIHCREAFNITEPPNVESINKLGGLEFSYPRVAFVDGAADPWRAATPHRIGLPERISTVSEPFILIDHGVHHWDENGVKPNITAIDLPPPSVEKAQKAQIEFVKAWLKGWKEEKFSQQEDEFPGDL
ncbi:peptidase S28 [Thelonectria olida]|uniref:Peptidase S28 n=1 Tax=Thelonectria olida TaxID=1576542 RepID=A0A9P8VVV8_9HYPO|nr:peptidase S28 [Thelonectria olida]